jgi:hypothetical protein
MKLNNDANLMYKLSFVIYWTQFIRALHFFTIVYL